VHILQLMVCQGNSRSGELPASSSGTLDGDPADS
jgi:hypothetical protein